MEIIKGTDTPQFKKLYDEFAKNVFDVSFMPWFSLNIWTEDYELYCVIHEEKIISSVSIYKMKMRLNGQKLEAIQLGAVGTLPSYRGQHLSRQLIEHVFSIYKNMPAFLMAEQTVVDFYPRFGFKLFKEKVAVCPPAQHFKPNRLVKIKYSPEMINEYMKNRGFLSKVLQISDAGPIIQFHLAVEFYDDIYYLAEFDMLIIAKKVDNVLRIFDIMCRMHFSFDEIAPYLDFKEIEKVEFMFQPDAILENYTLEEYKSSKTYGTFFTKDIDFKNLHKYPYILST